MRLLFPRSLVCIVVCVAIPCFAYFLHNYRYFASWVSSKKCFEISERVQRWKVLEKNLYTEIYGQHIAVDTVLRGMYAHITDANPKKALVLSFHGTLGSGKTHLSQLIAKHLFDGGMESPFVHSFIGPRHFLKDHSKLSQNQELLREAIEKAAKNCCRSLFIFDEVDKMPPEIFDTLVQFIDHHESVDGVDYRGLIFIFISNTGSRAINELVLQMKRDKKPRESIEFKDFKEIVARDAFVEEGGLFRCAMIGKMLIDYYVPFLPLEREHVIMCARRDIAKRKVIFVQPEKVADKITYLPKDNPVFSADGCKSVTTSVNFYIVEGDAMFDD